MMNNDISVNLAKAMLWLVYIPVSYIYKGWALSVLWNWFVPQILGAPAINIPQALGLAVVLSLLGGLGVAVIKDEYKEGTATRLIMQILFPAMCLLTGYIVKQFL